MNGTANQPEYSERRRVAITGIGVIAPNGRTRDTFWASVRDGKSAACPITRFPPGDTPVRIACEVKAFEPGDYMDWKLARRVDRSVQFGIAAATGAVADAGIDCAALDPDRIGVVEGTSVSNVETATRDAVTYAEKGYRGVNLYTMMNGYAGVGSGEISLQIGARGHSITLCSGSASGNDVIGYALEMIRNDDVDVVVAGGAEAPIIPGIVGTFCRGRVLSRHEGEPAEAMRPFDVERDGFVLGEGAAFLVLEALTHALARGAHIYAEVLAQARACESYHPVTPHPEGVGILRAMEKAVRRARIQPTEIDYVNAHGTATEANDSAESAALRKFFGAHAGKIGVSSTKPVTGHLLAAAGAIETAICALALDRQTMPPTINLRQRAPGCDLDYVAGTARSYPIRVAMNLNSGFGGKNACLLLRHFTTPPCTS